jgi:hypothetical protein
VNTHVTKLPLWEMLLPMFMVTEHTAWAKAALQIVSGITYTGKHISGHWSRGVARDSYSRESYECVHIAATKEQIEQVAVLAAQHFNQQQIMYYKIRDEVCFLTHTTG